MAIEYKIRLYPTTLKLPLWARPLTLGIAVQRLRVGELNVRKISDEFSLRGLSVSPLFPRLKVTLDPNDILEEVERLATVDGVEVVRWMHIAAAENAVIQARINEYNLLGSQLAGQSGDPYLPGLQVEDIKFNGETGITVSSRGYGIVNTPVGSFNVPNLRKAVGVFRNLLSWGSISDSYGVQWIGNLLKWKSLASTPINQSVGFYMDMRGNAAPQFFVQNPPSPKVVATVRMILEGNDKQTVSINFRDPSDYTRVLTTRSVDIPKGQSEISFTVSAFPYVPPLVSEIQPQDKVQTKLNSYTVS
jgi:hypothetical protein